MIGVTLFPHIVNKEKGLEAMTAPVDPVGSLELWWALQHHEGKIESVVLCYSPGL